MEGFVDHDFVDDECDSSTTLSPQFRLALVSFSQSESHANLDNTFVETHAEL